jgi:hypothetical protein
VKMLLGLLNEHPTIAQLRPRRLQIKVGTTFDILNVVLAYREITQNDRGPLHVAVRYPRECTGDRLSVSEMQTVRGCRRGQCHSQKHYPKQVPRVRMGQSVFIKHWLPVPHFYSSAKRTRH